MSSFEWDAAKADQNFRKHGIGFNDAALALLGLALTREAQRSGERRFTSICRCNGRVIVVVWTPRDGAIRLISARIARKNERQDFDQAISGSTEAR